jgi:hypothetical protein
MNFEIFERYRQAQLRDLQRRDNPIPREAESRPDVPANDDRSKDHHEH